LIQGSSESSPVRWVYVQEVPGDPLASVDEPPTTSTVESKLIQMLWPICHQIVIKLFFSCCGRPPRRVPPDARSVLCRTAR